MNNCTCGGCGTGTTCAYTDTTLKSDMQTAVYVYATPDILDQTPGRARWPDETSDSFFFNPRDTLNEELLKDLLERVQKLEKSIDKLRKENAKLKERVKKLNPDALGIDALVNRLRELVTRGVS